MKKQGFTLIELLIVVGILSVIAVIVVLLLNPIELFTRARDSRRLENLKSLNQAITFYKVRNSNPSFGNNQTVYISLPNTAGNCSGSPAYVLPPLPSGWSYACATESNYRKVDGSGWVPINFSSLGTSTPLSVLPMDLVNDSSKYYAYVTGNSSWELSGIMESLNNHDTAISDGGSLPGVYEIGTNLSLGPRTRDLSLVGHWKLDEGSLLAVNDSSGNGNNGTLDSGPTWVSGSNCKSGQCLSFDGTNDNVSAPSAGTLNGSSVSVSFWFTLTSNIDCDGNNNWRSLVRKGDTYQTSTGWDVVLEEDRTLQFDVGLGGVSSRSGKIDVGLVVNTPIFLSFTYDASTGSQKIYADGQLESTKANASTNITSNGNSVDLAEGTAGVACPIGTGYTPGRYDEVRVYDRALSQPEIQAIYSGTY